MTPQIPYTNLRLQPYIKLYTIKGGAQLHTPEDILALVQGGKSLEVVGAMQKVTIKQTRDTNVWRELNSDTYGQIQEVYPQLPEYSLVLDRLVLYQSNILEAFGFDGSDLLHQNKPFLVVVSLLAPTNQTQVDPITYIYHNCWMQNFDLEFDITASDLRMLQSVNVATAGVIPSSVPPPDIAV